MIGQKFNRLLVLEILEEKYRGKTKVKCLCDCGNITTPVAAAIKNGRIKSCGCYSRELARESIAHARTFTGHEQHGHSVGGKTSPSYQSWRAMHQRCYCPKNKDYHNYGGKGIIVYKEWESFSNFIQDMGERPSKEYSLDRIDPDKDYEPSNCQWILKTENSRKGNAQRRERALRRGLL